MIFSEHAKSMFSNCQSICRNWWAVWASSLPPVIDPSVGQLPSAALLQDSGLTLSRNCLHKTFPLSLSETYLLNYPKKGAGIQFVQFEPYLRKTVKCTFGCSIRPSKYNKSQSCSINKKFLI